MYGLIKTAAASLLMPLPLLAAVVVFGLIAYRRGKQRQGMFLCSVAVGMLLLLSWAPVADRLVRSFEMQHPSLLDITGVGDIDAIVVLGGGWTSDEPWPYSSRLSDRSALRLMEGIRLWRQNPDLKLVVTGRSRNLDEDPIALGSARAAHSLGVAEAQIVRLDWP